MKKIYIIGAGPAGITCALYLIRAGYDTSVIYLDKTSLLLAKDIQNYYGFESISGKELYERGLKQAQSLGINLYKEEVFNIIKENDQFIIETNKGKHNCDAVLIATGIYRNKPNVSGLLDFENKGISYCAVCDGFFFRKKKIGVIGNGSYALHEAEYLEKLTDDLTIYTNGKLPEDDGLNKYKMNPKKIIKFEGNEKLERIVFSDDTSVTIDGLFVAIGNAGSIDLALKMGILIENDQIVVDDNYMSNIPGIFAAGDCISGIKQISKAVSDGACAAKAIINYLR